MYEKDLLGGVTVIRFKGLHHEESEWEATLYGPFSYNIREAEIIAVPYALWNNRSPGEMLIWIRQL